MPGLEGEILNLYRRQPNKAFSTSEIVKLVEPALFQEIEKVLNDKLASKDKLKQAKRKKAQLHRKILYHLNKLVRDKILKVDKEGAKGELFFALAIEEGEEISIDKHRRRSITISRPRTPAMPIEGYASSGVIHKFDEATWIDRLNCLIFECSVIKELEKAEQLIKKSFGLVNDCIGLNGFEFFINNFKPKELVQLIEKLDIDCRDFGKKLCLSIELSALESNKELLSFISDFAGNKFDNISTVFNLRHKDLHGFSKILEHIVAEFSKNSIPLFIKNNNLSLSPYFVGSAGVYCFDDNEWQNYVNDVQGKVFCISCSHSSLSIDVKRFYDNFGFSIENFERFMINSSEALLNASSMQRRKSQEYFEFLVNLNPNFAAEVFMFGRQYIRFWNYDYLKEKFDPGFPSLLFERIQNTVKDFCFSEETIYTSCGMPTRFKIVFSPASSPFYSNVFTELLAKGIEIKSFEDFYSDDVKNSIKSYESLVDYFDGGSIVEFVRSGNILVDDVLREFGMIVNSYKIPFFAYCFKRVKGTDLKLDSFIGGNK